MLALMLTRVSLAKGDLVRFAPRHADPYKNELATIERILDPLDHELAPPLPEMRPYWIEVKFRKDGVVKTLNAQLFVLEEVRQNIARILH